MKMARLIATTLLIAAAVAGGVRLVILAMLPSNDPPGIEESPPTATPGHLPGDWPIFRGDQAMTGVAPGRLPGRLRVRWRDRKSVV